MPNTFEVSKADIHSDALNVRYPPKADFASSDRDHP
jgi:hypothetical protein